MEESGTTDKVVPSFTQHYCMYWRAGIIIPAVPRQLCIFVYVPEIGKVSALPAPLIPLFLEVYQTQRTQ